ncbi:amino acid ABC transporter ATP-binding protein [Agrobacterium tumefaciens]|uniref:amino acid ABC transporter ATP-binding protein n=1 Tax=Agrobacterium tumefaciens TaxID=358 RepID=UPI0015724208|nr:amino acid ABC transporter ATP-binding protein [Agrobacterium tumefaciens]NTE66245.1 amino acid ABC transporter ATP-binding protein [Agrobacterium tumefaciens]
MINLKGLWKTYGASPTLRGVDLTVPKGTVHTIIGPSGCGKSTLLRCVNLLEMPDTGQVSVDTMEFSFGPHCRKARPHDLRMLRTKAGIVFQSYDLFQNLTALDNVALGLKVVRKWDAKRAREHAAALLEKLGLAGREHQLPRHLSGGQAQRVAIARALAMEPSVILFDEVTAALDPELVKEVLGVLRQLTDEGYTMIVVTHEMSFARSISHRVSFMCEGSIVESSPPEELFQSPKDPRTRQFLSSLVH